MFLRNISTLLKNFLIEFFHCFSNLVPGVEQLKYQRIKRLKFPFLRFKTMKIGHFCTLNEKWLIPGGIQRHKKETSNRLALSYFSCAIPEP